MPYDKVLKKWFKRRERLSLFVDGLFIGLKERDMREIKNYSVTYKVSWEHIKEHKPTRKITEGLLIYTFVRTTCRRNRIFIYILPYSFVVQSDVTWFLPSLPR